MRNIIPDPDPFIARVCRTKSGFADIKAAADELARETPSAERLALASGLLGHDAWQVRMLATFLLGRIAADDGRALAILRDRVSVDANWRVQEGLAMAFDRFCADKGYEAVLPVIRDARANVRRAASEGLRIWTARPFFRDHPQIAIEILSDLKTDDSQYVRKSCGNALRDIAKKHGALVAEELAKWNLADRRVAGVHKLAAKFL